MKWPCLAAGLLVALAGCSNLAVTKITVDKRIAGHDHADGFRYYLSRPYVVVKKPIEVSTRQTLVVVETPNPDLAATPPVMTSELRRKTGVKFLEGPRRGQTIELSELSVTSPGSPDVRRLSDSEVASLRKILADPAVERAAAAAPSAPASPNDLPVDSSSSSGDQTGGTSAAGDSGNLPIPGISEPAKTTSRKSVSLIGDIEVVFMPDLDEQYAIKSKNLLSKNAFNLTFQDGWQLNDVSANHDSTTVAIAFLNTIDQAVNAAKSLATANLGAVAPKVPTPGAKSQEALVQDHTTLSYYYLEETTYLKPGMYRLNKPWEMQAEPEAVGCGLLTKLGLTTVTQVRLVPVPKGGS